MTDGIATTRVDARTLHDENGDVASLTREGRRAYAAHVRALQQIIAEDG